MSGGRVLLREASEAYRQLQGVFCIYKPPRLSIKAAADSISLRLTNDLNKMRCTRPTQRIEIEGSIAGEMTIKKYEDYSTHPLVIGPMFQIEDFGVSCADRIFSFSSGLCVMGVGSSGNALTQSLRDAQLLTTYTLEGMLGVATMDLLYTGSPTEKSSYSHVTRGRMEKVLYLIQSNNQRKMIDQLGLPPNSQEAYEAMSAEGLVRPHGSSDPIIYGIKLLDLGKPHFTLEVTGVNLNGDYLSTLINDIGLSLKTNAHTLQMRCIRRGPFSLDFALLRKHWRLDLITQNIEACQGFVLNTKHKHASLTSLQGYKDEQMKLLEEKKAEKMLQQNKREEMAMRMLEEFKADEQYEEFVKSEELYKV